MAQLINNTDYTFSPAAQQAITNAANYHGVEQVYTQRESTKPEDSNLFHFYEDEDFTQYLFSINVAGDPVIWGK